MAVRPRRVLRSSILRRRSAARIKQTRLHHNHKRPIIVPALERILFRRDNLLERTADMHRPRARTLRRRPRNRLAQRIVDLENPRSALEPPQRRTISRRQRLTCDCIIISAEVSKSVTSAELIRSSSRRLFTSKSTMILPPSDRRCPASACVIACAPPAARGHPVVCAAVASTSPVAELTQPPSTGSPHAQPVLPNSALARSSRNAERASHSRAAAPRPPRTSPSCPSGASAHQRAVP